MAKGLSFGSEFVGSTAAAGKEGAGERAEAAVRILILGDFCGGGAAKSAGESGGRRAVVVDRDNLDEVLKKFAPAVRLADVDPSGAAVEIEFAELDDFHPDRLYERLPIFEMLRDTRERLQNPATFAAAAEEVRKWGDSHSTGSGQAGASFDEAQDRQSGEKKLAAPQGPPAIEGNLLDAVLEQSEGSLPVAQSARESTEFQRLLAKVTESHRLAADDPRKQELTDAVDALAADRLQAILHHPEFQALEAAWREIEFLVRRVETDGNLKLLVVHLPKQEMATDLDAVAGLRASAIYKLLVDVPPGSPPWTLVIGNYEFNAVREDIELLGRIAKIAARAGAPFLAGASTGVFGCPAIADAPDPDDWQEPDTAGAEMWQQLRALPEATSLGLVAPRFLLRLPYGRDASPTERFEFEELPAANHAGYLWGNGAVAVACLLAQAFSESGLDLSGGMIRDLDNMPVHVYDDDGEPRVKPCAEAALLDRAVEQIMESGVMPLQSFADRGSLRLVRLHSLADPLAALAGRWR